MDAKLMAIALLVLACTAYAATRTLNAHVVGSTNLMISNCDLLDGPTKVRTKIYIENSLPQFMAVNYEYRDLPSGTWKSGGKLCNIPAGQFMHCETNLLIAKGGTGNGTFEEPLLRLIGTSEAAPGDTYEANLSFSVTHFTGEREGQLSSRLSGLSDELGQARASCTANPSCCNQATRDMIDAADQGIRSGNAAVMVCNLTQAYDTILLAESNADNATNNINTCLASVPSPTPTLTQTPAVTRTPAATQTPQVTGTPVGTQTAAPTTTPAPKSSICPLGLVLLFGPLGVAIFRR